MLISLDENHLFPTSTIWLLGIVHNIRWPHQPACLLCYVGQGSRELFLLPLSSSWEDDGVKEELL